MASRAVFNIREGFNILVVKVPYDCFNRVCLKDNGNGTMSNM